MQISLRTLRALTIALVLTTVLAALAFFDKAKAGSFKLEVLDVGQGDAVLVTTPKGARVLIDGGPGDNVLSELGQTLPLLNRRIDLVILTHPDADHLEGLIPVLRRYQVGAVLRTNASKSTAAYETFENVIWEKGILDEKVFQNDRISVDDGTQFTVLWPPVNALVNEVNESSLVLQLTFGGYKFLLTGDIGQASERVIVSTVQPRYLRSEVLKVPHHGSRYSSSEEFLRAVKPRISAISVGGNNFYGHPTEEVLARLASVGSEIFRTDLDGLISFEIDKDGLRVKSER